MSKPKIKNFLVVILAIICMFGVVTAIKNAKTQKVSALTKADIVYHGCDISEHQPTVNYATMKSQMDFLIVRIGNSTREDYYFKTHVEGAKAVGLPLGLYIYSLASTTTEAINEANWIISTLANYGYNDGTFTYPIYFDYEESSIIQSYTNATNTAIINAFCDTIRNAGYYPGVYMGASNYLGYTNINEIRADAWIAAYSGWDYYVANYHRDTIKMWQFDSGEYGIFNDESVVLI